MKKQYIRDREGTIEDLEEVLRVGQNYLDQLDETLKDIRVPVRSINPEVLNAIKYIFGDEYITENNESYVTYEMLRTCMTVMRNVGRATAAEFVK